MDMMGEESFRGTLQKSNRRTLAHLFMVMFSQVTRHVSRKETEIQVLAHCTSLAAQNPEKLNITIMSIPLTNGRGAIYVGWLTLQKCH